MRTEASNISKHYACPEMPDLEWSADRGDSPWVRAVLCPLAKQALPGLPPVETQQLAGRTLTLASCSLKVLVLNIWATASNAAVRGSMNCSY